MNIYDVTFLFEDTGIETKTVKAVEGESILDVALENNIELCHNCGGVCACTTCHVYIEEGMENLSEMSEREENYVDRAINPRLESRLACQSLIYVNVTVKIPDQSVIIGH